MIYSLAFIPILFFVLHSVDSAPFKIQTRKPARMQYVSIADYHFWQWIKKTDF